jgi:hypothetical protein
MQKLIRTETCECLNVDDLDLAVFGDLCRASFGFKAFTIAGPTSSMVAMVCLFSFRQMMSCAMWLLKDRTGDQRGGVDGS